MHIVWVERFRCRFIENFARNTFRNYAVSFLRQTMQLARPVFAASSLQKMCRKCLIARFPSFRPSSSPSSSSSVPTRGVVLSPHNKCWTYDERWRYGGASQQLWFNILPLSIRLVVGGWRRWVSGKELHMHADFWDDFFYFIWDSPHSQSSRALQRTSPPRWTIESAERGDILAQARLDSSEICRDWRWLACGGEKLLFTNLKGPCRKLSYVHICAGDLCAQVSSLSLCPDRLNKERTDWRCWAFKQSSGRIAKRWMKRRCALQDGSLPWGINNDAVSSSGLLKLNQCGSVITI